MPRVGFELTILVFERAKTIHALERAATVIGNVKTVVTIIFKQGVIFSSDIRGLWTVFSRIGVSVTNNCGF
jgi:hypothetical protein